MEENLPKLCYSGVYREGGAKYIALEFPGAGICEISLRTGSGSETLHLSPRRLSAKKKAELWVNQLISCEIFDNEELLVLGESFGNDKPTKLFLLTSSEQFDELGLYMFLITLRDHLKKNEMMQNSQTT